MPLQIKNNPHPPPPKPEYLTLDNFKRGVITLIDKSRLPKNALEEANNIFLYEDGQPGPRPGVDWFGTAPAAVSGVSPSISPSSSSSGSASLSPSASASGSPSASVSPSSSASRSASASRSPSASASASLSPSSSSSPSASASQSPSASNSPSSSASGSPSASNSPSASASPSASVSSSTSPSSSISASLSLGDRSDIDGFDYFDNGGVISLVAAAGGTIYRSLDDAQTWTVCTGAVYTPGNPVYMNQSGTYLYITNGIDPIIRYDGSTTLVTYTSLSTPAAPTIAETGLASTGFNYYYKVARANTIGFSTASVASSVVNSGVPRDSWNDTTDFGVITTPNGVANQTRWDIYMSENDIDYYYIASVTSSNGAASTYKDNGSAIPVPGTQAPTDNTTLGPLVEEFSNVGSRMYGVRDSNNRYRIWFSGSGNFAGSFSPAYDGGYLDWQEGGKYIPMKVEDYRDGKGTPLATVWCKSADGQGCILQMSLDTLTIGDISITVPSAYKLPGSRGTPAPGSVVNVLNDYFFYNSQAFYNLGSRAQFLNLLSTDESSANIRPTVKQITTEGEGMIASVYFDARVYFSVPYGAGANNHTAIYDTERKAWLPKAFTRGFTKFLRYTDTNGINRLLALGTGDSAISEISSTIQGDYGEAFETSINTGLYPVTKNRFEFQFTEEGEVELSNPVGIVTVDLLGIDRVNGYSSIQTRSVSVTTNSTSVSWNTFGWNTTNWNDTSVVPVVTSEPSIKRYFPVQQELNAVQWRITTNSRDAHYILRNLQTWGTQTQAGKPTEWLLTE